MSGVTRALAAFVISLGIWLIPCGLAAQPVVPPPLPPGPVSGNGTIEGRVTFDDGKPIADATVRAVGPALRGMVSTDTDLDGRYLLEHLPAGMILLSVSKPGLIGAGAGSQAQMPNSQVQLADGATGHANFTLARGGVIAGRIIDAYSEPMSNVQVMLLRKTYMGIGGPNAPAEPRLTPMMQNGPPPVTNDLGEFRIFGIPPGRYYLSATYRRMGPVNNATTRTYAPMYYPGTTNINDAVMIDVTGSSLRDGMDLMMTPVQAVSVSGVVVDGEGKPITTQRAFVNLQPRGGSFGSVPGSGPTKPDGTFEIFGVPPGSYTARASMPPPSTPPPQGWRPEQLIAYVDVSTANVTGVVVAPVKIVTISGRVVADPPTADFHPERLRLMASSANMDVIPPAATQPAAVNPDGTFEIKGSAVPTLIAISGMLPTVRAIRMGGRDFTDKPLPITGDVADLEITVATNAPRAHIRVTNAAGDNPQRVFIAMFPQDRREWAGASRRFQMMPIGGPMAVAGPGSTGRAIVVGTLPAGRYYVAAVDMLDIASWRDPYVLDRLSKLAVSVDLHDGEDLTVDVPLTTWKN